MDTVRNEEVCREAALDREFGSSGDQRVLRRLGLMEILDE